MAYSLKSVTIRADNTESGMEKVKELWADIMSGKIPLEFIKDGEPVKRISPVSAYSACESDEKGAFNLTVMCVKYDFFLKMEQLIAQGKYKEFEEIGDTVEECADRAWSKVWELTYKGELERKFSVDYESTVPAAYSEDGKAHCCLYIAVK